MMVPVIGEVEDRFLRWQETRGPRVFCGKKAGRCPKQKTLALLKKGYTTAFELASALWK